MYYTQSHIRSPPTINCNAVAVISVIFFTAQIDFPLQIGYTVLREGLLYAETI